MNFRHVISGGVSVGGRSRIATSAVSRILIASAGVCAYLAGCVGEIGQTNPLPGGGGATSPPPSGTASTGGGSTSSGAGGATNTSGGAGTGTGSTGSGTAGTSVGGATGTGSGGATGAGLPCDVQALLSSKCWSCHGATLQPGAPSLGTYAALTAASARDPSQTNAQRAVARMQDNTTPMPPAPGTRATPTEIAAMQAWVSGGYSAPACGSGTGTAGTGGGAVDAGTDARQDAGTATDAGDPFGVPPKCTSGTMWTGGDRGSANMNPGLACINCHTSQGGEAPRFSVAGTVYPSAHEPDRCNGANGSSGIQVQIIPKSGQTITLTPNSVGNFTYTGTVALPYQAKVIYMGRERIMSTPQQSGDCNGCHTQSGAMSAPGRILLP
jgi:mono/diheme cytochrome c family protein